MDIELVTRRRALLMTYRRYLEADREWDIALRDLHRWFPETSRTGTFAIGNEGSPVRRLYARRQRALVQLEAMRRKLEVAKQRMAIRQAERRPTQILFIGYTEAGSQ